MINKFGDNLKNLTSSLSNAIGQGLNNAAQTNAKAASTANKISQNAQTTQGIFNQASADNANMLMQQNMLAQQAFNSAQATATNQFNEKMWEKAALFNKKEAEKQRKWIEKMQSTAYQRQVEDLKKAGLNPIMATGMAGAGATSGATASINSTSGAMANSGMAGAESANINNYAGQMENTSNMLALFGAVINGLSTAYEAAGKAKKDYDLNFSLEDIINAIKNASDNNMKPPGKSFTAGFRP